MGPMPAACDLASAQDVNQVPQRDIRFTVGRDEVLRITFRDKDTCGLVDWTGWTFAAKAKDAFGGTLWSTANTDHGGTDGTVVIVFPRADTALLTAGAEGVWDLRGSDPDGFQHQILEGEVEVEGAVT